MMEEISKRQEANLQIGDLISKMSINSIKFDTTDGRLIPLAQAFLELAKTCPQQRAGQIICNYLCPDYRDTTVSDETKRILETLFPNNPDPFFEESVTTLKRLTTK